MKKIIKIERQGRRSAGPAELSFSGSVEDNAPMRLLLSLAALLLVAACIPSPAIAPTPTVAPLPLTVLPPTETPALAPTAIPAPTLAPAGVWQPLFAGAEVLSTTDGLIAIRHLAAGVRYSHRFEPAPGKSRGVGGWLAADGQALAAINCGFYLQEDAGYRHIGLLMSNGEGPTRLRSRWGGVLIVRDGAAFVVRNPQRLLAPATLGLQGWPMLVEAGVVIPGLNDEDNDRRTAAGVDGQGRVVWVAAARGSTLAGFARRLLQPDLGLVDAVNLDGGSSTGLRWRWTPVSSPDGPESLPVPCAILLAPLEP
jgi:hypothetical protein